ncbi:MAG: RelA/SpoT domain-containing protein [Dehalococcoidia bacterium]|jgi:ppGpp synthetase/RelA/SpoT-type nucleotidyltranferase
MELEALRERWIAERGLYKDFSEYVKSILEAETRRRGIACIVSARAKEVASLLKKALRKRYTNPYDEIFDKAGVRVVLTYYDQLDNVEKIIRGLFNVLKYENKIVGLDYDQLGYLGIHFRVTLQNKESHAERFHGLICEIQLHTRAQNLWADVSHELMYKPLQTPPVEIKRAIYRLMSLVEIFDQEIAQARSTILELPGFQEAGILDQVEKNFLQFTVRTFDRKLSLAIIPKLLPLFSVEELEGFGSLLDDFVEHNQGKLEDIFRDYAQDERCNPLLFQPETLLVFERLDKDPFRLKHLWADALPVELLESLAIIWGKAI